jgi:hypothetical protein
MAGSPLLRSLWREVAERAVQPGGLGGGGRAGLRQQLGQPEVGDDGRPVAVQQHVAAGEVAVDDGRGRLVVQVRQRARRLDRDREAGAPAGQGGVHLAVWGRRRNKLLDGGLGGL